MKRIKLAVCDRAHLNCTGTGDATQQVRDVTQIRPEQGERVRKGRAREKQLPILFVGLCCGCNRPRALAYPPREILALPFDQPPAPRTEPQAGPEQLEAPLAAGVAG